MSSIVVGKTGLLRDVRADRSSDLMYHAVAAQLSKHDRLRAPGFHFDNRWNHGRKWPILGNNKYGCCTFASIARHMINASVRRGKPFTISDNDVIRAYLDYTGGVDSGAMLVNVFAYVRNHGIGGHKVRVYARCSSDPYEQRSATQTFGGIVVTAGLPQKLDDDRDDVLELTPFDKRDKRDVPRSMGGHAYNQFAFQKNESGVVLWEDDVTEQADWTGYYREEAWCFIDDAEDDAHLIEAMEQQLDVVRS